MMLCDESAGFKAFRAIRARSSTDTSEPPSNKSFVDICDARQKSNEKKEASDRKRCRLGIAAEVDLFVKNLGRFKTTTADLSTAKRVPGGCSTRLTTCSGAYFC
jgi:hypothetical protein